MEEQICTCSCACKKRQPNSSTERWNANFFQKKHEIGTRPDPLFIDTLEQIDVQRKLRDAFLSVSEISGSSWKVEQVQRFFREARNILGANIWVDFRQENAVTSRCYSKWIDSHQLAEVVARQRIEWSLYSLMSRRLSFVPYISPQILEDLVKSATDTDVEALRHATFQYFTGETLMRVHTSTEGFPVFRLIFNLPCLSLEEDDDSTPKGRPFVDDYNKRKWEDLSHLPLQSKTGNLSTKFSIYETRTTVVISGRSNTDWFGYAFGNTVPIDISPNDYESDEDDDTDNIDGHGCEIEPEPEEDLFTTGGCELVLNPDNIVQDPRIYYLRAIQIRLSISTQASEYLVRKLDAGCQDWIPLVQDHESNQRALEKIVGMTRVFRLLHRHYAQSIDAWTRFSDGGDVLYFADVSTHAVAREALSSIKKSFEKISDLQRRVRLQIEDSTAATVILKMRMAHESNRISLENINMSRRLTEINLDASHHSKNAAESAAKSSAAGEETSRSSRVNIQLFMLTTAFIIALQYFCSERALFAFERSPQAFWISIVVLIPSLLALSCALQLFDRLKDSFTQRIYGKLNAFVAGPPILPVNPA